MLTALCAIWLLTAACADDVLFWDASSYATEVCTGTCTVYPAGTTAAPLGCWFGTVTLRHTDGVNFSDPVFFEWAADPGRWMEWENACPIGVEAECLRSGGRKDLCRERAVACRPACGED